MAIIVDTCISTSFRESSLSDVVFQALLGEAVVGVAVVGDAVVGEGVVGDAVVGVVGGEGDRSYVNHVARASSLAS